MDSVFKKEPLQPERCQEVFLVCVKNAGYVPWCDQLRKQLTPEEIEFVKKLPGHCFADAFLNRRNKGMYLDWINNFVSYKSFAKHYQMTEEEALEFIKYWQTELEEERTSL